MTTKKRWTLIPTALALAGAAWLVLMWSTHSQATDTAPEPPSPEMVAGDVNIVWLNAIPVNLSRSQERGWNDSKFPRIVAGPDKAHVVWEAVYVSGQSDSLLTYSDDLELWSEPQLISESLQTTSEHTNFAQSANGALHLVWHEIISPGAVYQFMYQKRPSANTVDWTEELDLYDRIPVPAIAVQGVQNVHIAWLSDYDVFHTRSTDGGASWLDPTRAVTLPTSSLDVALAIDSSNRAHVVWMENLGLGINGVIMYRVGIPSGDGTTWGTVVTPSAHLTNCVKPSIVVAGSEAYIGWGKVLKNQKLDVYFARCSALACTTPITLGRSVVVNTSDPSQSAPVLAIDENGTLAAVWHGDQEHSEPGPFTLEEILFTYSTDGGTTWAEVQNVSQTPLERSIDPHLALVDGVAHVVWKERYDDGTPQKYDIWYAKSGFSVYLPLVLKWKY